MKFTLEINCDNAAFADCWRTEVATILETQVIPRLLMNGPSLLAQPLRDGNGNKVGEVKVNYDVPPLR
jgi:hypothetical protein